MKVTRRVELSEKQIELLRDTLENTCDRGPTGEGYQSEELSSLSYIFGTATEVTVVHTKDVDDELEKFSVMIPQFFTLSQAAAAIGVDVNVLRQAITDREQAILNRKNKKR